MLPDVQVLDSIHHGTAADLWALSQILDLDGVVWGTPADENYCIRSHSQVSDAEVRSRLAAEPCQLQLLHRSLGITGHYAC